MTTIIEHPSTSSHSIFSALADIVRLVRRRWTMRRAEQHLLELPDYMLKDMGISRCEIGPFVSGQSTRHPHLPDET
jgi:uncharacterized protein YjiS (DUF1127 family)